MTTANATGRGSPVSNPKVRSALTRYRVMAYITGTLLVVLTVAFIVKYTAGGAAAEDITTIVGIAHGWLFVVYLLTVLDLTVKARLAWSRAVLVALCGTIPVLTFVAERWTTRAITGRS